MKWILRHIIPLLVLVTITSLLYGQKITFKIEGKVVTQTLSRSMAKTELDSCLFTLGFDTAGSGMPAVGESSDQGWKVMGVFQGGIVLQRGLESFDQVDWSPGEVHIEGGKDEAPAIRTTLASFGFNRSELDHIKDLQGGKTRFFLKGFEDANEVYLSGNFCQWSTLRYPMEKTRGGWTVEIELDPGVWGYKFVVDGVWHLDPQNEETYFDGHGHTWNWQGRGAKFGNENSVYVKTNHTFRLPGHLDLEEVVLSGSFNGWPEKKPSMIKGSRGWYLPVYLHEGTHRYKYVLDDGGWFSEPEWILDPTNPKQRGDGTGNMNSILEIGEPYTFKLRAFKDAKRVILTGSFIDWNEGELMMSSIDEGWELPVVLAPGNYEYKYIVDGQWMLDPNNQTVVGEQDYTNSVVSVAPNHLFELTGYPEAKEVRLSGNFNDWADPGYTMERTYDGWQLDVHLPKGKNIYKFVVDGKWIHDPGNPQKERNEYNEFNSVLWKE